MHLRKHGEKGYLFCGEKTPLRQQVALMITEKSPIANAVISLRLFWAAFVVVLPVKLLNTADCNGFMITL